MLNYVKTPTKKRHVEPLVEAYVKILMSSWTWGALRSLRGQPDTHGTALSDRWEGEDPSGGRFGRRGRPAVLVPFRPWQKRDNANMRDNQSLGIIIGDD